MNKRLIRLIQSIPGVVTVEPWSIDEADENQITVTIVFEPKEFRLTPEEVALRNYNATVRRGQINDKTTFYDFWDKIDEESNELFHSSSNLDNSDIGFDPVELADISIVCDCMSIHYGIDLQLEKEKKMLFNEVRK